MFSKTHIDSQTAHGRQLNAKSVWYWKYHFCYSFLLAFFLLCSTTVNYRQVQVLTVVFAWNCLLSLGAALWPISVFITMNSFWSMKLFITLPTAVRYIGRHFLMLYAYAYIVSFPNQRQVIGLGTRLVNKWHRKLTNLAASVQLAQSLPIVAAKAYAIGKALLTYSRCSLLTALVTLGWSCSCLSTVVSFHVKDNQLHRRRYGEWSALHQFLAGK